jgi:hypothetical protein
MARRRMTYRVVELPSPEGRDARLGATAAERLVMLRELSRLAWEASGRPLPSYSRANIPFRWSTLREQGSSSDR